MEPPVVIRSNRQICDDILRRRIRDAIEEAKRILMDRTLQQTRFYMNESDYHDIVEWGKK